MKRFSEEAAALGCLAAAVLLSTLALGFGGFCWEAGSFVAGHLLGM